MIIALVIGFAFSASAIIGCAVWAARESDRLLSEYFKDKDNR